MTYCLSHNIVTFSSKKFRLFPERLYQRGTAAHPTQCSAGRAGQLSEIFGAQIGQLMLFAVTPDVFHRIEFRGIGGKVIQVDLPAQPSHILTDGPTAVRWQSIPNDQQLGANMPLEVLQELNQLRCFDASGKQPEIKAPNGDSSDGRKALPIKGVLQDGSFPTRSPGANAVRPLAQAALVHKHYRALLLLGFFFSSGQRTRFQRRIAGSSRWVARPVGRWQLQPKDRRIRQTCPG